MSFILPIDDKRRVDTPIGCDKCVYREEAMRDGGWCYMFREMPSPTCAQFKGETYIRVNTRGCQPMDAKTEQALKVLFETVIATMRKKEGT